jgi:branched-chain amino acid aminotransferase
MCGTAAEVTPVRSVDDHELGVGPVTMALQSAYLEIVRGAGERWSKWREIVPSATPAA